MTTMLPEPSTVARLGGLSRAQKYRELRQKSDRVWRMVTELDDVAPAALDASLALIERAARESESIAVESALDLHRVAGAAEILHRISRLASGQSTSNVAHAGDTDRAERIAELRARLAQHEDSAPSE